MMETSSIISAVDIVDKSIGHVGCVGAMEWNSGSSSVSCSSVDSRCGLLLSPRRQRKVLWTPSSAEQSDMILKRPVARALAPD